MVRLEGKKSSRRLTIRAERDAVDERRVVLERSESFEASAVDDVDLGREGRKEEEGKG